VYLINDDAYYHQEFSLCHRLGMSAKDYEALLVCANLATIDTHDKLVILKSEWDEYLSSWYFDALDEERPRIDRKRIDLHAVINSEKHNPARRSYLYSLQIGRDMSSSECQNIVQQLKTSKHPPSICNLRSKQRAFGRAATPFILQALCANERLHQRFMSDGEDSPKRKVDADDADVVSPPPRKKTKQVALEASLEFAIDANNIGSIDTIATVLTPSPNRVAGVPIDNNKYPMLAKIQRLLGDEWNDERTPDVIFDELARMMKDGHVVKITDDRGMGQSWVKIPVNGTDLSHSRRAKEWIEPILQINGKNDDCSEAARCMCNYLAVHHSESMMCSLKEKQYPIVEYMNETRLAAMWEDANVNFTQEGIILKHLRQQFGPKTFATMKKVRMLCDGHTEVKTGKAKHAYEEGEKEETLEYSYKSLFDEFAEILKQNKRADSPMSDSEIEELCQRNKQVFLLWDGAFAFARTVNPTSADCANYLEFVQAAVDCHVWVGCNVTHKVHLMLLHVLLQMRTIPRGLGEKMEDWVELQHQIGGRQRRRFRTIKDFERRAIARARSEHRGSNAAILSQIARVKAETSRDLSSNSEKASAEDEKRERREKMRSEALKHYKVQKRAVALIVRCLQRAADINRHVRNSCEGNFDVMVPSM
jgi:hypothetical protein